MTLDQSLQPYQIYIPPYIITKGPERGEYSLLKDESPVQDTYYVDLDTNTCTCPAFRIHNDKNCKHLKLIKLIHQYYPLELRI